MDLAKKMKAEARQAKRKAELEAVGKEFTAKPWQGTRLYFKTDQEDPNAHKAKVDQEQPKAGQEWNPCMEVCWAYILAHCRPRFSVALLEAL